MEANCRETPHHTRLGPGSATAEARFAELAAPMQTRLFWSPPVEGANRLHVAASDIDREGEALADAEVPA